MANSRLNDDTCSYQKALKQSIDPLQYILEPSKYIHSKRCRMDLGIVGGNTVSTLAGEDLVVTESELLNITRPASRCPSKKYVPGRDYVRPDKVHLNTCQLINYKTVKGAEWVPPENA